MSARLLGRFTQVIAVAAFAGAVHASPIPFEITGATINTSNVYTDGSAMVTVTESSGLAGMTFDLDGVGDSSGWFNFLDVTMSGIGGAVDLIQASLDFLSPVPASADGSGFAAGAATVSFGITSTGLLAILSDPAPISFGDTGQFIVDFMPFFGTCFNCSSLTGNIAARVTLLSAPTTSVPEPATLSLLGAGLLAIGFARRRRAAA